MKVNVEELVRLVSLMTGENPATMCSATECPTATLADRIAAEIEWAAAEAILATPLPSLSGWHPMGSEGMTTREDGSAVLPLPDDFLILLQLRLRGWARGVTEICLPGSVEATLQGSCCPGLRATSRRPLAVMTATAGKRALLLYGKHTEPAAIEEGWYMPAPRIDPEGNIEIPEAALERLVERLSKTVC